MPQEFLAVKEAQKASLKPLVPVVGTVQFHASRSFKYYTSRYWNDAQEYYLAVIYQPPEGANMITEGIHINIYFTTLCISESISHTLLK